MYLLNTTHFLSRGKMYAAAAVKGKTTLNHIKKATSDKTSNVSLSQSQHTSVPMDLHRQLKNPPPTPALCKQMWVIF